MSAKFITRVKAEDDRRAKDAHRPLFELTSEHHGSMK